MRHYVIRHTIIDDDITLSYELRVITRDMMLSRCDERDDAERHYLRWWHDMMRDEFNEVVKDIITSVTPPEYFVYYYYLRCWLLRHTHATTFTSRYLSATLCFVVRAITFWCHLRCLFVCYADDKTKRQDMMRERLTRVIERREIVCERASRDVTSIMFIVSLMSVRRYYYVITHASDDMVMHCYELFERVRRRKDENIDICHYWYAQTVYAHERAHMSDEDMLWKRCHWMSFSHLPLSFVIEPRHDIIFNIITPFVIVANICLFTHHRHHVITPRRYTPFYANIIFMLHHAAHHAIMPFICHAVYNITTTPYLKTHIYVEYCHAVITPICYERLSEKKHVATLTRHDTLHVCRRLFTTRAPRCLLLFIIICYCCHTPHTRKHAFTICYETRDVYYHNMSRHACRDDDVETCLDYYYYRVSRCRKTRKNSCRNGVVFTRHHRTTTFIVMPQNIEILCHLRADTLIRQTRESTFWDTRRHERWAPRDDVIDDDAYFDAAQDDKMPMRARDGDERWRATRLPRPRNISSSLFREYYDAIYTQDATMLSPLNTQASSPFSSYYCSSLVTPVNTAYHHAVINHTVLSFFNAQCSISTLNTILRPTVIVIVVVGCHQNTRHCRRPLTRHNVWSAPNTTNTSSLVCRLLRCFSRHATHLTHHH